jgi:uncharacterized membrane protein YhaH (DUF805 family)
MTFPQSISTVFRKYAEFNGVATRPEFWWWILFTTLVNAALSTLSVWNVSAHGSYPIGPNLTGLWAIAVLVPTLAVTVRRLRSTGRSWANLFWLLLPVAGLIVLVVLCAQPDRVSSPAYPSPSTPL